MIVTIDDVRKTGHCVKGARDWFDRHHLDFRDFISNGIDEKTIIAIGDSIGLEVAKTARARRGKEEA